MMFTGNKYLPHLPIYNKIAYFDNDGHQHFKLFL